MSARKKKLRKDASAAGILKSPPSLLVVALILLAGLALLYPEAMLRGNIFASADAGNSDAFASVADASLAEGHYPLWNPYLFAGMPTFGSLAYVKFVYPPTVVFNFLQQKLAFPPLTWMLAHLLFGGLGMAWLLSRWKLPLSAMVLGALVWIFLPKVVAWGVHGHGTKLGAAMYLPWIVAASVNVLSGRGWRAVAWTALLLGLQLLRGHIQITYYTLLIVAWLALWNSVRQLAPGPIVGALVRWRRAGLLLVALVLAMAIGAVLLIPEYCYQGYSVRGGSDSGGGAGMDYATGWSLAPSEVPTFWLPTAAGFGKATYLGLMPFNDYPNYFGLLVLGLAAMTWGRRRRWLLAALGSASILALAVSFGRHWSPFYGLLYDYLPFFNRFRIPSMILIVPGFALAVLAAHGASRLAAAGQQDRWLRFVPWLPAGLGALLLMGGVTDLARGPWEDSLRSLAAAAGKNAFDPLLEAAWHLHRADLVRIGLVLMTTGAALRLAVKRDGFRRRGLIWTLMLLAGLDLAAVDSRIVHPENGLLEVAQSADGRARLVSARPLLRPYRRGFSPDRGVEFTALAALTGHDRVWPLGSADRGNMLMNARIRSLGGYHAAKLASYEMIRSRLNGSGPPAARLAAWLGASQVLIDGALGEEHFESLRRLGADLVPTGLQCGSMMAYENRSALPRARLVDAFTMVEDLPTGSDQGAFLDGLQSGRYDFTNQVVLEQIPSPLPVAGEVSLPPVNYLVDGLDEVVLRTGAERPTVLVLADMYMPGWQVEVDGEPAELLRADLFLRAVALQGGSHEIRFTYRDASVRLGVSICVAGLLVVLAMFIASLVGAGRRQTGTPESDRSQEGRA